MIPLHPEPTAKSPPTKTLQSVVAALFLIEIGGFIWVHRGELDSLTHALRSGRWPWLLAAAVCEALYFLDG